MLSGFGLALRLCVESTHDALEIREFLHHVGGQVALAQESSAVGVLIAPELFHHFDNPIGLVEI